MDSALQERQPAAKVMPWWQELQLHLPVIKLQFGRSILLVHLKAVTRLLAAEWPRAPEVLCLLLWTTPV